jgi:hypothetical protein
MDRFNKNAGGPCCWSVNGIANSGVITGQVFQADFNQAWFTAGTDEDFYLDNQDTFGTGVNSGTDVVGYDGKRGWFAKKIEANEGTNDATQKAPSFITIKFPNSSFTVPFELNNVRGVVGTYTDTAGKQSRICG